MILIAIGANLPRAEGGTPLETCRWAVGRIAAVPGMRVVSVSAWYESAPMPPSGQPPYINGVVAVTGDLDPARLLAALQGIEVEAGRARTVANAARPLDLDIIAMGGRVRDAPDPILPHPRAHARAFVLLPLRDVAPGWRDPRSGHGIDALIASLPEQQIRRLPGE
jgi:2-amino-4-hydroxy-6-hydroxymethyldihydropteridine diphosphokinase